MDRSTVLMLPRTYRLKKDMDIEILFHEGQFVFGRTINMKMWRIDPAKYPKRGYSTDDLKIGVTVGKGISKSAVVRNRVKRQVREAVRLLLKDDHIRRGYMIMFLPKANTPGKAYQEIVQEVGALLRRSGVYRPFAK